MLLGGLLIHGLVPGPRLFEEDAEIVTGLYLGSLIAAVVQIVIGAIILPVCIWLVNRPRPYLAGFIYALVVSGIYTVHLSIFDVGIVIGAGLLGYFMRHFGFPVLPAVLGVVLGELIEANYRRSIVIVGRRLRDLPGRPHRHRRSSFSRSSSRRARSSANGARAKRHGRRIGA